MIPPVAASDLTHRANGRKYFTHDDEIIACGSILSGPAALRSDPKAVVKFTDSFIKDRFANVGQYGCNILGIRCVGVYESRQETLLCKNGLQDHIQSLPGSKQHRTHGSWRGKGA